MKKRLLCLIIALSLISFIFLNSARIVNILAESNEGQRKVYELNDEKIPKLDLNSKIDYLTEEKSDKSLSTSDNNNILTITYDAGDPGVPTINTDNINVLTDISLVAKGDYIPNEFYDLGYSNYAYGLTNLRYHVYTNYYFNANPNGCISVSINGLDGPIIIRLYEQGTDKYLSSWTGDPVKYSGVGFTGLATTKLYYFRFTPENYGVPLSGSGLIFHDN